mmetsp:Transcript_36885/g.50430  ORF Transcript_36885/g.50430 Transcript_36885/m.50430 type:complete len:261 (+) Transcript_36885:62-844(+)
MQQPMAEIPGVLLGQCMMPYLHASALRSFALSCRKLLQSLRALPAQRRRAQNLVRWNVFGGGASGDAADEAVAKGGGGWHPGGVALAEVQLTDASQRCVRFELEVDDARGDLLLGLSRCCSGLPADQLRESVDQGYSYIMGRDSGPPSIFYGGYSLRCCYSLGDGQGPRIDYGTSSGPQVGARLAKLRHAGDWVEFRVQDGIVSARDYAGGTFQWNAHLGTDERWQPAVAWTGSKAPVRVMLKDEAASCVEENKKPIRLA